MKMKNVCLVLILFLVLFSTSCDNVNYDSEAGLLMLRLSNMESRNILPDIDMIPENYIIRGSGPNGESIEVTTDQENIEVNVMIFGEWNITVEALNNGQITIGNGSGTTTIHSGQTSVLDIEITPLEGFGTFNLALNWDDNLIENPSLDVNLIPGQGNPISIGLDINGGTATSSSGNIPTGFYTLVILLYDNGSQCGGAVEVVRIVKDQVTSGTINIDTNPNHGGIQINLVIKMNNPIDVVITGQEDYLTVFQSMTVAASAPSESVNLIYVWYLQGVQKSLGQSYTFGNDLLEGVYRLDVTVFTADGERGGSATHSFNVIAQ